MESSNRQAPGQTPAFEGQCAFAVSTGKVGVPGAAQHRLEADGRTYWFKNGAARFLWRVLPGRATKADEVWRESAH